MVGLLFTLFFLAKSSYIPGTSKKEYKQNERIDLLVDTLSSAETQLPFDYYYLPFCGSEKAKEISNENLGQALIGESVAKSPYIISMQDGSDCSELCSRKLSRDHIRNFRWMIERNYRAMWILDSLPSGMRVSNNFESTNIALYEEGFPIGFIKNKNYYIYNHHHIIVKVYKSSLDSWYVVGFLIQPFSFENPESPNYSCKSSIFKEFLDLSANYTEKILNLDEDLAVNQKYFPNIQEQGLDTEITFTYSVRFENSKTKWVSRWDVYLFSSNSKVHWLSIINSFVMVLLLSLLVAGIFRRAVNKDISYYNETSELDTEIDSGWKQLKGDIFREPVYSGIFSILVGSGVQLICMCLFTLFVGFIGFLTPEYRGALLTTMLLIFAFTGNFAGYTSGRLYKLFSGEHWKKNIFGTAVLFPGMAFTMFFLINLMIRGEESSGAVSFGSLLELLLIWFGISLPLTFLGGALGYKKPAIVVPTKLSRIPKPFPTKPLTLIYVLGAICGALPFFSAVIELNYIMNSIWHYSQFYYLFGFLLLCFIIVVLVSGEIGILIVYVLICREDYRWWWTSFLIPGLSGFYMLVYSVVYYFNELSITRFSSIVLYFGYMAIGSTIFSLVTGTVGFLSSFVFVKRIYSMIKLE